MKHSKTSFVSIAPDVLFRHVGDETVLLGLDSESYFGLDAVGTRIWRLVESRPTVGDLVEILLEEYDVDREVLENDVDELLSRLVDAGLVRVEE
jgi:hypothetical protein